MLTSSMNSTNAIEWTTICIKRQTRNELASIGSKDSRFEDILQELLKQWRDKNG